MRLPANKDTAPCWRSPPDVRGARLVGAGSAWRAPSLSRADDISPGKPRQKAYPLCRDKCSLLGVVRIRHLIGRSSILRRPLVCTGWALREFPIVCEKVFEIVVVPLHRVGGQ